MHYGDFTHENEDESRTSQSPELADMGIMTRAVEVTFWVQFEVILSRSANGNLIQTALQRCHILANNAYNAIQFKRGVIILRNVRNKVAIRRKDKREKEKIISHNFH
jgi:hypothetical protein